MRTNPATGSTFAHPICAGESEVRYARKGSAAICYGALIYRPGKDPAVITNPTGAD